MRIPLPLLVLLAACAAPEPPDRTNMKGWELYCRRTDADAGVTVVLLAGTNRLKTIEEIEGAPDAARGLDGARRLLATLAPGQIVMLSLPRVAGARERGFVRPLSDSDFGTALAKHAQDCGVELGGFES